MGRSVKNFCKRVYFRRRCRYKDGAHTENNLLDICLFTDFAGWKTN